MIRLFQFFRTLSKEAHKLKKKQNQHRIDPRLLFLLKLGPGPGRGNTTLAPPSTLHPPPPPPNLKLALELELELKNSPLLEPLINLIIRRRLVPIPLPVTPIQGG